MWPYGMTTQEVDEFLEEFEYLVREYLMSACYQTVLNILDEYDSELTEWLENFKGREDIVCRNLYR